MQVLSSRQTGADADGEQRAAGLARRGNRRRLAVFGGVFLLCLVAGQAWNYSRTELYRATARLQVVLPDAGGTPPASASGAAAMVTTTAQANQLQVLTSRPMLAKLARALAQDGLPLGGTDEEAAERIQAMLRVEPVPGTDVLQLEAVGESPKLLAAVLNRLPDVVRDEMVALQAQAADNKLDAARKELALMERSVAERRAAVERFRNSADVQTERDENEAVARSKGLNQSLSLAVEKEAAAHARVQALGDGTAPRGGLGARDDTTLTGMETRAAQMREELRDMERQYTPDFMAMDPRARALRARLAELERQVVQQRSAGQQSALQAAQLDLAAARAAVERLRTQLTEARPGLKTAASRFAQSKLLDDDLTQVEKARRELLERVARLEADQRRRTPSVTVVEAATRPMEPFDPDHGRDSLLVAGSSLLAALLVMGLVELFNRAPTPVARGGNTTVVVPAGWGPGMGPMPALAGAGGMGVVPQLGAAMPTASPGLLAPPAPALLQQDEAGALLAAAQGPARLAVAAGLMGLSTPELLALRAGDIDPASRQLRVGGSWARVLGLPAWLAQALPPAADPTAPLLRDAAGQALAEPDLQALLACAAVDAGLPQGATLNAELLRNTCIAWLVGQGLRFSDLPALVGRLDPGQVAAFAGQAAESPRRTPGEVALLMPALQQAPAA